MTAADLPSPLGQAALQYARRGWKVFPCRERDEVVTTAKGPRKLTAKAPYTGAGVKDATADEAVIRGWWRRWPDAMIGLPMGDNAMFALDFDPREDPDSGEVFDLERLKRETEAQVGCPIEALLATRTQSDGVHVLYSQPSGEPIRNRGNLPRHVDVRGMGGYIVAPPSVMYREDGSEGRYRWLRGHRDDAAPAPPQPLVDVLRDHGRPATAAAPPLPANDAGAAAWAEMIRRDETASRYAASALEAECRELAATPKGGGRWNGRNNGIFHAALKMGGLVAAGAIGEGTVRAAIAAVIRGMPHNDDPDGAMATLERGLADGQAKPRDLGEVGRMTRPRGGAGSAVSSTPSAPERFGDPSDPGPTPDDVGESHARGSKSEGLPASSGAGRGGRIDVAPDDDLDRHCAFLPLTDLGNAERFRARHGHRFRFCKELGWFLWDGRRWRLLSEEKDKVPGEVSLAVFETVRAIRNEAALVVDSGHRPVKNEAGEIVSGVKGGLDFIVKQTNTTTTYFSDSIGAHAKSSEGASRLGCIANLAKAFAEISINADQLDADRMAINVQNGTLRLVQGEEGWAVRLDPHRATDLISKMASVDYEAGAIAPAYDKFLEVVQPEPAMRRFLHQWGGLSLTGDIGEQKLAFFHGKGRNGKSTLVDAWGVVAGDYGGTVAIETFLDQGRGRKGGEATPDLARLPGVRFLRTSEPEKGAKLAEALIKLVTGGEPIDARHLNKGFFTFLPSFKLTISGNHQPKITGHDDGIWRRVMLVPWAVQIEAAAVDRSLPGKLKAEASGILNRLLDGLIDRMANGLIEPDSVVDATRKYRERSDQLGRFLADCVREGPDLRAPSQALFDLFTAWSKATGGAEWTAVGFSKAMEDRGFEKKTSNGVKWLGIEASVSIFEIEGGRFTSPDTPAPDPAPDEPLSPRMGVWDDD